MSAKRRREERRPIVASLRTTGPQSWLAGTGCTVRLNQSPHWVQQQQEKAHIATSQCQPPTPLCEEGFHFTYLKNNFSHNTGIMLSLPTPPSPSLTLLLTQLCFIFQKKEQNNLQWLQTDLILAFLFSFFFKIFLINFLRISYIVFWSHSPLFQLPQTLHPFHTTTLCSSIILAHPTQLVLLVWDLQGPHFWSPTVGMTSWPPAPLSWEFVNPELANVLGMMSQILWVLMCNYPTVSGKHGFAELTYHLGLLQSSYLLLWNIPES